MDEEHGQYGDGLRFTVLLLAFFGSPVAGVLLANQLAPESDLAGALAGVCFGGIFIIGCLLWLGLAVLSLFTPGGRKRIQASRPPSGSSGFAWAGFVLGACAGLICALAGSGQGLVTSIWVMTLGGWALGYVLHRLARAGLLPFPEEG